MRDTKNHRLQSTTTQLCKYHHPPAIFMCDDSADHRRTMVFRHDDSTGHHNSNVGPFRHNDSAGRSHRGKGIQLTRESGSISHRPEQFNTKEYPKADIKAAKSSLIRTSTTSNTSTDYAGRNSNSLLKSTKGQKNHRTTIVKMLETATTSCSFNLSNQVSKLVSIERPRGDELSATNGNRVRMNSTNRGFSRRR
ncbi:hypothetical protein F511_42967 [Dorcoceras hygrometricum]|uniref:Uncharacterized protein n=1 Tax=Dorcoceras hygrometricum TaxID=472368 RepID=A0A2Z7AY45_9LAMI|nr:hypothetical protein F511_23308 [Dorcoceras hygrometricum]KZV26268.1 hypothetical protein F511_42967 [Dorcoceras hygrometricum]